jgi:chromosome segregation ATPase
MLRIAFMRYRLRRNLYQAETELGWLGWEQVEFYDEQTTAEVKKIQEFENTQAFLQNTSAELSGRKAALDAELTREKTAHDQTLTSLTADRAPLATQLQEAETTRQRKLESIERFDRAIDEISAAEKKLEALSESFMNVREPSIAIRIEAREVSDQLGQFALEKKLVAADKATAAQEAVALEATIDRLREELQHIDAATAAARDNLSGAARRVTDQVRVVEREKKKSSLHMAHLDREKQKPYQFIGAVLADHKIAPRNQPQILEKVIAFRERYVQLGETISRLRATCAAADKGLLISFYLLLFAVLIALSAIAFHFL